MFTKQVNHHSPTKKLAEFKENYNCEQLFKNNFFVIMKVLEDQHKMKVIEKILTLPNFSFRLN